MEQLLASGGLELIEHVARRIGERTTETKNGLELLVRIQHYRWPIQCAARFSPWNRWCRGAASFLIGDPHLDIPRTGFGLRKFECSGQPGCSCCRNAKS